MKRFTFLILLISGLLFNFILFAEPIDIIAAKKVAENKISLMADNSELQIKNYKSFFYENQPLFFVFELSPSGYMVISADTDLPPVIAYSFENNFTQAGEENNPLKNMLLADLVNRKNNIPKIPHDIILKRNSDWNNLLSKEVSIELNKSTPKPDEILIQTNWGQGAPYNNFCPMDPVTNQRSIAGCPAVAMAQIVNYYETINETVLSDLDDYYHSYAGRNYWIDDDFETIDFPDFSQLNSYLDTLKQCWIEQASLKANEMAALNFACGIAAKQVYTSEASGTFGVDQAFDAYLRFGFNEAILMDDSDTSMYTILAQNMMEGRPAHLAVVDPGWTMGHNVVVDGYSEEGYFHLNFGWTGSYNGFYLLPDEIPYGLTVIEGVVMNIGYPPVNTDIPEVNLRQESNELSIYPNPAVDQISIKLILQEPGCVNICIYDEIGKLISSTKHQCQQAGSNTIEINLNQLINPTLQQGIYFCKVSLSQQVLTGKFIIR